MERFKGKVVLVTGAGRGIGAAIAQAFANEGAAVALGDKEGESAKTTAEGIMTAGGIARAFALDVTDPTSASTFVSEVMAAYGSVDVLVNSAGVREIKPVIDLSYEEWKHVLERFPTFWNRRGFPNA